METPIRKGNVEGAWGSDALATLLRNIGFDYVSLTPGASFRGLHDSLVNFLGNERPKLLLCIHEEHAVAIAHGYAKVTGRPMAVALHSNVGLMHATMAIFNAWCDRVPIVMIGAQGPMDASRRRPWVDWLHTARDLGSLIRGYTKWDDQPTSIAAATESIIRANVIAQTAPPGPVYVCLDQDLQEQRLAKETELPPLKRFPVGETPEPARSSVREAARLLTQAKRPLILMGRTSRDPAGWQYRVRLAEALQAPVVTDLRVGASFPTGHVLHPHPPGLFLHPGAVEAISAADVILSLDWLDLAGALQQAEKLSGKSEQTVIHCSVDQYSHNGWSMDHLALPTVDLLLRSTTDVAVPILLEAIGAHKARSAWRSREPAAATASEAPVTDGPLDINGFARTVAAELTPHNPSYIRLPIGWPGSACTFDDPLAYIGFDGGGGVGSGPGMAVGAALALKGNGRLPVAILGDGDFLMAATALWTAVHYRIPLLVIIANNQSFFNDEVHQERVARTRDRPVENRWIGMRIDDPACDLGMLARAQGCKAFDPIDSAANLARDLRTAIKLVQEGHVAVLDVRITTGYEGTVSAGVKQ